MPPTTRAMDATGALHHMRCNVLGDSVEGGRLESAFANLQVTHMTDFLIMERDDFESATIASSSENPSLTRLEIRKLLKAQEWYRTHPRNKEGVTIWFQLSKDEFNSFLANGHTTPRDSLPNDTALPDGSESPQTSSSNNAAPDFVKGIKRDVTQYKEFTDDRKWHMWNRHLKSMAATHGIEDVLSIKYEPQTNNERILFKHQQNFAYSIFERCLKTSKSMKFVREFEEDRNAQQLYGKLCEAFQSGVCVDLRIEQIEADIQALRLDTSWNRTLESFFVTFDHKILDLESASGTAVRDVEKRKWLDASIRGHPGLHQAATTSKIVQHSTGNSSSSMTYDAYYSMLLAHAQVLDRNNAKSGSQTRKVTKAKQYETKKPATKDSKRTPKPTDESYIQPEEWRKMTSTQRREHIDKWKKVRATRKVRSTSVAPSVDVSKTPSNPTPTTPDSEAESGSLLRSFLSANNAKQATSSTSVPKGTTLMINGQKYAACVAQRVYQASKPIEKPTQQGSLIDSGCNGGLAGDDVLVLEETLQRVDVAGIADALLESVPVGTVAGVVTSTVGPIVMIFHQYAIHGSGHTIHSVNQLRSYGLSVDDIPKSCEGGGGNQRLITPDGYTVPFAVRDGLCYMDMRAPTELEMENLPHVIVTADITWDPQALDCEPDALNFFDSASTADAQDDWVDCVDHYGETFTAHELQVTSCLRAVLDKARTVCAGIVKPPRSILPKSPNYDALRPFFGWISADKVKNTLENTTQWFRASGRYPMRRHYKTRFPAANVIRWNEDVATDTFFSDTPAHDDGISGHAGCTMVQLYTGVTSHYTKVYPMNSEAQIPNTLQDLLRDRGAPNNIRNDCAKAATSNAMQEILRHYKIGQFLSEPRQQNQNPAERRIQDIKNDVNRVMDRTGTPPEFWLLCTLLVVYLSNLLSLDSLHMLTPTQLACGHIPDTSALLHFR